MARGKFEYWLTEDGLTLLEGWAKQTDFARDMQMLNAGIMNAWEFRARWMNEDEATAKAALPKMEDMTDEKQNEVE